MSTLPIPERNMIDIHMHLVPGVDDGAENMEMALVMMIRAKQQGISQIIATPHSEVFRYSKEGGKIIFKRLVDVAAKVCPDMKLYLGCEVYCETEIMDQVLESLNSGRYPTINGTKYVLMEFPSGSIRKIPFPVRKRWCKPDIGPLSPTSSGTNTFGRAWTWWIGSGNWAH